MANKPFAIQGADLTLGGVTLQAGATGVVIPGITQAVNYRVEEVDENGSDNSQDLGSDAGAITVIDNSRWLSITTGNNAPSASYVVAEYSVDELDNGNIEEINVETAGVFLAADKARVEAANMWATLQPTPFTGFNSANWIQIPFRPKLRTNEVENIGGSGNLEDIVVTSEEEFTKLTLANKDFTIETTRTDDQDADINLTAADDIFITALNDDIVLFANDEVRINTDDENYEWIFDNNGNLTLPQGGDILDSTGASVLGGGAGDNNIWVQDFTAANIGPDAIIASATSVEYDADGNIIALFAATTANYDYTSTVVAKFNTLGVKQWELIFGGGDFTDGWGLAVDPETNYGYIAGRTSISGSYNQSLLTRIDLTDGSISWSKQLDFEAASDSPVVDVAGDGNPVLVGYATNGTDNYIHVVKLLASDGSFMWGKTLDGYGDEEAYGMGVGPAGEVVVVGFEQQFLPPNTVATISIEPVVSNPNWTTSTPIAVGNDFSCTVSFTDGVPTFTNIVDRVGNRTVGDVIASVQGAGVGGADGADDMTIKVGTVSTVTNNNRVLVAKYAANGDLTWQKSIVIDAEYDCNGADADIDSAGNIYVCGQFDNPNNNGDQAMFLFQMNSAGVGQWTRKVSGNCQDAATSIVVGPDDHLYLSGVTGDNNTEDFNLVIAKYNLDGTVVWQRLLDNTTTWTFNGVFWFGDGSNGGSNLAVKNGYVAIAGGFADPFGTIPHAIVAQIDTDGTQFATGNYDFKNASFSGLLTSAPTIVDDIRVDGTVQPGLTDFDPGFDINFGALVGDLHVSGSGGNSSINNNAYSVSVDDEGVVSMVTSRGTLEFGALPEPGGASHFHIMPASNQNNSMDLYFGDDFNYVLQRASERGVEIGANDRDGGDQQVWRFGTDGTTTFPTLSVQRGDNPSGTITGQTLLFGDNSQEAIISTPDGNVDYRYSQRLVINPGQGYAGGEGGDIYLWAGRGGASSGTGGDIKIRGGQGGANTGGGTGGAGGYIRVEAGDAPSTGGSAGYVEIRGGNAPGAGQSGGNIDIISGSGAAGNGTVRISTIDHNWYFGIDGDLTLPAGGDIKDSTGASVLGGGGGTAVETTRFLYNGKRSGGIESDAGMSFKSDGTKFYLLGSDKIVYEYTLSTAWDVSTSGEATETSIGSLGTLVDNSIRNGLFFKPDGTEFYLLETFRNEQFVDQFYLGKITLSTAWDLSSTLTYVRGGQISYSFGQPFVFSSDGLNFYHGAQGKIGQWTLSTAWDISTITLQPSSERNFNNLDGYSPYDIAFSADGTVAYISTLVSVGFTSNARVIKYTLGTAWDITTATLTTDIIRADEFGAEYFGFGGSITLKPDLSRIYLSAGPNNFQSPYRVYQLDATSVGEQIDGGYLFADGQTQYRAVHRGQLTYTWSQFFPGPPLIVAPTTVNFNVLYINPSSGYTGTDPVTVTLPTAGAGTRLVILATYNDSLVTVNESFTLTAGIPAEFIYIVGEGWIPLYGATPVTP